MTSKLKKCLFFTGTIYSLGHIIRPGMIDVGTYSIESIEALPTATNMTELRSFLGLCNVFRHFVPRFAHVTASLNKKLRNDQPFKFGELKQDEVDTL